MGFIVILLAWISFFPQPLQEQYWLLTKVFLGIFLLILLLEKRGTKSLFSLKDWPLWLFLLSITGAILSAQNKEVAIRAYLDISLTLFLLYYLSKAFFSSGRDIGIITKTICLFSTAVAVLAILEWSFGKNPIYEYLVDNPYYKRYIVQTYIRRPMSTQLNPVVLGTYLLGCLPFGFILIKHKSSFFRSLAILSIILNIAVIILTLSRGVFLGLIALFLFYFGYKRNVRFLALFVIVLLVIITLCSGANEIGFGRFGFKRLVFGSYDSILSPYRLKRMDMAFNMVRDYPSFGVGLNHFRIRFNEYYPQTQKERAVPDEFMIADNMYLTLLAETGIVGFSGFLVFIFYLLRRGIKSLCALGNRQEKKILLVAISALVGLLVNMGAYELFYWYNPFALFCLLCGAIAAQSYKRKKDRYAGTYAPEKNSA